MKKYELTDDEIKRKRERLMERSDKAILFHMFLESDMDKLVIRHCDSSVEHPDPNLRFVDIPGFTTKKDYNQWLAMARKGYWLNNDLFISKHGNEFWLTKYKVDGRRRTKDDDEG